MTNLIKKFTLAAGIGALATGAIFTGIVVVTPAATDPVDSVISIEASVPEMAEMAAIEATVERFVDEFTPIQSILPGDTIVFDSLEQVMSVTGLTREEINRAIVGRDTIKGYTLSFDFDLSKIMAITPGDTAVYPNMEHAVIITGIPEELISLSLQEHYTVEGQKFEYDVEQK